MTKPTEAILSEFRGSAVGTLADEERLRAESDATFAQQLGVEADEYASFRNAWMERGVEPGGGEQSGMPNIPWLPEGFDLAALLQPDDPG